MTANPLKEIAAPPRKSVFSAAEWAVMAEDKGLPEHAKAWWKAAREGWDDEHYDPVAATAYKKRVADKRAGRI